MNDKGDRRKGAASLTLVMAGGGTGGHLFPAMALAGEFKSRYPDARIVFIGGKGGIEEKLAPGLGYELRLLDVEGVKNRRGIRRIRALVKAVMAAVKAVGILREIRPDGVIGSGSYSSAPVVSAACLLGMKTAILEQNALAGLTNRVLGRFVDRVYIAFAEARRFFPMPRTVVSGNPVRREILGRAPDEAIGKGDKFTILVFGGSQGATAINTAFVDATEYLTDIWPGLTVVHQTGKDGYDQVVRAYRRKGLKVDVHMFIDDMAGAYRGADLAVCRAGATTLAELTALGVASILIPYPFASDDHQSVNARCMADSGAAVVIEQDKLTGAALAAAIKRFYGFPGELKAMREKARGMGRPSAAVTIADDFLKVLNKGA
ncbi:MAG: undecaprenyldiphospho-muramoylpentapeptide beta-N-acetylglucosaminyltransferase [Deltaproteobacteria bacterium]